MQPSSFDDDLASDWAVWVLDHGLPGLPDHVEIGQAVPIAYWAGSDFGAVKLVRRFDADPDDDAAFHVDEDVFLFRRMADGWDELSGNGGTNWAGGPSLARFDVPANFARVGGFTASGDAEGTCVALDGVVGSLAAWIEVTGSGVTERRPVVAPTGAVVIVCPSGQSLVRILAEDDTELMSREFETTV